ncbi:DUF4625 domain-containing protein [Pedobacter sp. MC2016-14]|uniref:DUF4625 domain-containing protein n=1 Tax=Pedobacter sp. MC2016-14 TaxID=2897327 RepID=UPI001E2BEE96|nr:DUF4625 domain-containing protein [Pedobacter sp. MC2016-14]MCD0489164.1 DUF4625 domain-containing protein [Pedobacter sp. MC2016-14]
MKSNYPMKMMTIRKTGFFMALLLLAVTFNACKKDKQEEIDTAYPVMDVSSGNAFPKQCSTVKRGEKFTFRAGFSDNVQLGSVSVDIHHNFDQHSHSTEVSSCSLDAVKTPVKPFLLIKSYAVPQNLKTYQLEQEITVPADVDPGDYHFLIRVTDAVGWQTIKGLSIKIN